MTPKWRNSSTIETFGSFAGIGSVITLPVVKTNNQALYQQLQEHGGPAILCTTAINASSFGRAVKKQTNSPWYHSELCIPYDLAKKARATCPDLMVRKPSPRWRNSPTHPDNLKMNMRWSDTTDGRPVPWVQGIPAKPKEFECVSSGLYVVIDELQSVTREDEQVIAWLPTDWTEDDKLAIAIEAYKWVGEIYDIFEIGNWVLPFIPNPPDIKVCSTATETFIAGGDYSILNWMIAQGLDPQRIAPRDIANWCVSRGFEPLCFQCSFEDYINTLEF